MAAGRPTKYRKEYCQMALDVMGDQGKSITQLARDLRVSKSTIYEWAENHSEFSDALDQAREWSQAHWEDRLEEMMFTKEVNAPLVKLYFANRFKWHDKPEADDSENKAQPLNITFEVRDPVKDVKTTNAKPK